MRSIILAQSLLFVVLFSGCATVKEKLALSYDLPVAGSYWVERTIPTEPLNAAETLAVRSAVELTTIRELDQSAVYESKDGNIAVIRYEQQTTGDELYITTVKYRIMNGLVYGESTPIVIAVHDPKKEEFAHEVAFNAIKGINPDIPPSYEGRMFIIRNMVNSNSCRVDVVEKDLDREYVTYHVRTC